MKRKRKQQIRAGIFNINLGAPARKMPTNMPFMSSKVNNMFSWHNPTRNFPLSSGPQITNPPMRNDFLGLNHKPIITSQVVKYKRPLFKKLKNPFLINKPSRIHQATKVTNMRNLRWSQAVGNKRLKGSKFHPFGDADRDGKINFEDCFPFNKRRQGEEAIEPKRTQENEPDTFVPLNERKKKYDEGLTERRRLITKGKEAEARAMEAKAALKKAAVAKFIAIAKFKQQQRGLKFEKKKNAQAIKEGKGPGKKILTLEEQYAKEKLRLEKMPEKKPVLGTAKEGVYRLTMEKKQKDKLADLQKKIEKSRAKEERDYKITSSRAYKNLVSKPLDSLKEIEGRRSTKMAKDLRSKAATVLTQRYTKRQRAAQAGIAQKTRRLASIFTEAPAGFNTDFGAIPQEDNSYQESRGRGRPLGSYKYGLPIDQYKAMQRDLRRQEKLRQAMAESVQQQQLAAINQQVITQGQNMTPEQLQTLLGTPHVISSSPSAGQQIQVPRTYATAQYDEKEGGMMVLNKEASPYDEPKQYTSREQAQQIYEQSLISGGRSMDNSNKQYVYQAREKRLVDPGVKNQVIQVQNDGMRKTTPTQRNNPWNLMARKKFNFSENNILDSDLAGNVVTRDAAFGNILNAPNVFAKDNNQNNQPTQVQLSFTQAKWKEAPNVTAPGNAGMNAAAQLKAASQQRQQLQMQEIQQSRQRQQEAMARQQQLDQIRARKAQIYNQQIAEVRQQLEDQGYPEDQIDEAIDQFVQQQRQQERMQGVQQEQIMLNQAEQQLTQQPQTYNQVASQVPKSNQQPGVYNQEDYWDTEQEIDQYTGSGSGSSVPVRGYNPGVGGGNKYG